MHNHHQGRDGQPLADQIILRPDVDPFPPQRASLIDGLSNLSSTVDGISSHLNHLSEQFTSLHKQVNFEHDSRTVEIDLDLNSIKNRLPDSVRNWSSSSTLNLKVCSIFYSL